MDLIKVQAGVATRAPLPAFLVGLQPESLADLSWTDPTLGVRDSAWWPAVDRSPALGANQVYGAEALTVDATQRVVVVTRSVLMVAPTREQMKQARQAAVDAITVTVSGKVFDGDEISQDRMARALRVADSTGQASCTWVLHDNTAAQVTRDDLAQALALAMQAQGALWVIP